MICALALIIFAPFATAQELSADQIMSRAAENQRRAEAARKAWVYDMNVFVRLKRANGKLAREESRDYVVLPGAKGAKRKLVKTEGKILEGKNEIPYSQAGYRTKDSDVDGAITDSFARDIMWRNNGMGPVLDWFPLSGPGYTFRLDGEERYRESDVYKISFLRTGENCWTGEALIERNDFQPLLITTHWTCKIPRAVTLMLGTSISQVGAKITYERFDKDVWFPILCGGEIKVRVLFLYTRTIAFSAKNSGFRKADVQSSIQFANEDD